MGCKTESGRKKGMHVKEMVRPFFCSASSCHQDAFCLGGEENIIQMGKERIDISMESLFRFSLATSLGLPPVSLPPPIKSSERAYASQLQPAMMHLA